MHYRRSLQGNNSVAKRGYFYLQDFHRNKCMTEHTNPLALIVCSMHIPSNVSWINAKPCISLPVQRDTEYQRAVCKSRFQLFLGQGEQPRIQPPQLYIYRITECALLRKICIFSYTSTEHGIVVRQTTLQMQIQVTEKKRKTL